MRESFGFTAGGLDRPDIAGVDKSDQIPLMSDSATFASSAAEIPGIERVATKRGR